MGNSALLKAPARYRLTTNEINHQKSHAKVFLGKPPKLFKKFNDDVEEPVVSLENDNMDEIKCSREWPMLTIGEANTREELENFTDYNVENPPMGDEINSNFIEVNKFITGENGDTEDGDGGFDTFCPSDQVQTNYVV